MSKNSIYIVNQTNHWTSHYLEIQNRSDNLYLVRGQVLLNNNNKSLYLPVAQAVRKSKFDPFTTNFVLIQNEITNVKFQYFDKDKNWPTNSQLLLTFQNIYDHSDTFDLQLTVPAAHRKSNINSEDDDGLPEKRLRNFFSIPSATSVVNEIEQNLNESNQMLQETKKKLQEETNKKLQEENDKKLQENNTTKGIAELRTKVEAARAAKKAKKEADALKNLQKLQEDADIGSSGGLATGSSGGLELAENDKSDFKRFLTKRKRMDEIIQEKMEELKIKHRQLHEFDITYQKLVSED